MRVVVTSDTHFPFTHLGLVPDGDLFIHCGDHTMDGTPEQCMTALEAIEALPHRYKIVVGGNHDFGLEKARASTWARNYKHQEGRFHYLHCDPVEIEGIKFWGSPRVPALAGWAFVYPSKDAEAVWSFIPEDTEVLVTHGPSWMRCDFGGKPPQHLGCPALAKRINNGLPNLRLHTFGHIHEAYGTRAETVGGKNMTFVNAAMCTYPWYKQSNPPVVLDLERVDGALRVTLVRGESSFAAQPAPAEQP